MLRRGLSISIGSILCVILALNTVYAARIVSISTCEKVTEQGTIPVNIKDQFTTDAPSIHAVVVLDQVKAGTKMKGIWVSVDAIEVPDYPIDSTEVKLAGGDARAHFALSQPNQGWPAGSYKLDLYIDNNFVTSVPFTIAGKSTPAPSEDQQKATPAPAKKKQAKDKPSSLIGSWVSQTQDGPVSLIFQSSSKLMFDGEPSDYALVSGAIQIQDENGVIDYPYTLLGDSLTISFPDGYQLQFIRGTAPATNEPTYSEQQRDYGENQRSGAMGNSELMQHFAGTWVNSTTNTETRVTLTADGGYYENYEASYSGGSSDQYGNQDMSWGQAGQNQASGRWSAQGTREKGQITLIFQNGNQRVINYQVHVENGQVYWGEYWFNGELYGKQR